METAKKVFRKLYLSIVPLSILILTGAAAAQTWIQLYPIADPINGSPELTSSSIVYNPAKNRVILFGGATDCAGYHLVNDVWVLTNADGTGGTPAWQKLQPLTPNGAPSPREVVAAAYDQTNNRMIVHGGYTMPGYCEGVVGDTWVLTNADGTGGTPEWIPLSTAGPARRAHSAAYDAANNRLMVHGGMPSGCGQEYDKTWVFTNANGLGGSPVWTQLNPSSPIPDSGDFSQGSAGYDPASQTLVTFVRYDPQTWGVHANAVRVLSNANGFGSSSAWTQLAPSDNPPVRDYPAQVYDAASNRMVVFGGASGPSSFNDVWRLSNANGQGGTPQWTQLSPTGIAPIARSFVTGKWNSAPYNPQSDRMIVFGGYSSPNCFYDVWVLTEAMGQTLSPQPCVYGITPINNDLPASGDTGSITVTASPNGCTGTWTAESTADWITVISGGSGTGSGTVNYAVAANLTSSGRAGAITVAERTFTVLQAGAGQYILSVTPAGTGSGLVTSVPSGILCGSVCSELCSQGDAITLTATASAGSAFDGWSGGGCSGTDPCTVTMTADFTVSARFSLARQVKLAPQVLMAGFDPIILDLATTRVRLTALVREGNQPIRSVSITDNTGSLSFAMNLIGSLSNGDLLYGTDLTMSRGPDFSLPNLFGSDNGQILIKAVDATGLSHRFPTVVYGNNPDLTPNQIPTSAPPFTQSGCRRLLPQVMMAGLEPALLDFDDTELKVRAMVREGSRPIQDVSLKVNSSSFSLAMDLVETLPNGDRLYEKAIVFQRGSFGDIAASFENLWGGKNNQFMIEARDDAGQTHRFPDIRRGDYRTINAAECWSDQ